MNEVVPAAQLAARTRALAEQIATSSPRVLGIGKAAFYAQFDQDQRGAFDYTKAMMTLNALSADAQEGICTFLEKRSPRWPDR